MSLSNDTAMTMPVMPAYNCGNGYGNNNGWGGDWASWILLFVIFGAFSRGGFGGFGGWGNGNDGCGCCAPATCADLQNGFNNQSVMNKLNGLENGLCSLGYDQLNQMNGINTSILNGFHGVDNAVCQLGYQTQTAVNGLGTQLQQCCFDNARAIDGVNYNLATQASGIQNAIQGVRYDMDTQACDTRNTIQTSTRDIIDNQTSGINAIMGKLSQMEYNGLNDKYQAALAENQALKFQASQTAQNAFITANQEAQTAELLRRLGRDCPVPAYVVPNPNCCYNPCGTCA